VEIGVAIFEVDVKSALFMLVIEVVSLVVSHCNHGYLIASIKTGRDHLGSGGLLDVYGFISPPMDELVLPLSPSSEEISVSSTFEIKSLKYRSASSVNHKHFVSVITFQKNILKTMLKKQK
jgi:hypothetical protein